MSSFADQARRFLPTSRPGIRPAKIDIRDSGFTLIELLVTLTIIAILGSLTLAGLAVARQRVKIARTESTIRKIHEVVMPHFERLLTRTVPTPPQEPTPSGDGTANTLATKCMKLLAQRRILALELPDGWNDLTGDTSDARDARFRYYPDTPISTSMKQIAALPNEDRVSHSDAECLWASVMQGGFADPAIVAHFREDEFSDRNRNGRFEFIDGWSNPIRFLRWAPAFISKYQPIPRDLTETRSHDAFDLAGLDPLARNTLFPLIFSGGPDGEPSIRYRQNEGESPQFSYAAVSYDPYFSGAASYSAAFPTSVRPQRNPVGSHFVVKVSGTTYFTEASAWPASGNRSAWTYSLTAVPASYTEPGGAFGSEIVGKAKDDITNHAMSR